VALVTAGAASLAACASLPPPAPVSAGGVGGTGRPYQVNGVWYTPREQPDYDKVGTASWYGDAFDGRMTADGEIFDMNVVSGAHPTLPLPSIVEVTNLDNGRRLRVRVNDRGPFVGDRIIDLSHEAARQLGYDRQGLTRVRVRYVGPAPLLGPEAGVRVARARTPQTVQLASAATPRPPKQASGAEHAEFTAGAAPIEVRSLQVLSAMPAAPPAAGRGWRIQAGAFSEEARARRAADRLAGLGAAVIEPMRRPDGLVLYRVMLPAPSDALQASDLRQRVAAAGFADARVIGPF
jgi:rare lipoprotein A